MTRPSSAGVGTRLRIVAAAIFLCLFATGASAQLSQATIDRIVTLNVDRAEAFFLWNSGQVERPAWMERQNGIDAELKPLLDQIRALPADEQRRVNSEIKGLSEARIALSRPQWQAKADAFRKQRTDQQDALAKGALSDAQKALEPQRRRALLQERRDRGEITADAFAAEDRKALDEIMALRGPYAAAGQDYDRRFDSELARLTQEAAKPQPAAPVPAAAVAEAPQARRPAPQPKVTKSDSTAEEFARDVQEAASFLWSQKEADRRLKAREIAAGIHKGITDHAAREIERVSARWVAAGRGAAFEQAYRAAADERMAAEQADREATALAEIILIGGLAAFVLAVAGGIYLLVRLSRRKPAPVQRVSDVHGTAHYAATELSVLDDACLAKGVFFGKSSAPQLARLPLDAPGAPVCSTPEHHTLIVARTRTGKGTRVIVPTLLRYEGSAFVIDPKGENAAITARVRRDQLRQDIHILNPWNELPETYQKAGFGTATYNPLDILDRNDPNVVAIAQALAGAICPAPANAKDRFWQGSASNVLTAVFLWLAEHEGLGEGLGEAKTLGRARQIVSLTRREFTEKHLVPMAASDAFGGAIRELAAPFIDLADETYSGVMSNLSESTKFLSDPQVKAATATSSFSMEDLAARKTTVYVVIPTDRMDTQKTWLRLVIAAAMHTFKRPKQKRATRHRTLFLIDEFAALGRLDDLPRDIATMGGFGVDFALVVQGLDQLKDHYGEAKGTILSNCAYKWFCDVNDLDSARYLSDTLGKATVATSSTSASSSAGPGGSSSSQSTTFSETGRFLLNPDEVLNLGKNVAIAIQPNGHAQYVRPVDYWNLQAAFGYLREGHPGLYWEPPLTYDPNPYVAVEEAAAEQLPVGEA